MIAPKGPGHTVRAEIPARRRRAGADGGDRDVSGNAHDLTLSYGSAIGAGRAGIIETTFARNARPTCSASRRCCAAAWLELMKAGYETLVDAGLRSRDGLFRVRARVKLIVDLIYEGGIATMNYSVSTPPNTANTSPARAWSTTPPAPR